MSQHDRLQLAKSAPEAMKGLVAVESVLAAGPLDAGLRHLVKLRVSQINGCAHCVDMHLREARQDGESQPRLDRLVVWRNVEDFTPAERAALAWAEALTTRLGEDLDSLHAALSEHFGAEEIAALTASVTMINGWNRLMVASLHARF
ncbi:alkylhydroperoxidase AhpD family core domain-containing protein [Tistlia consotensis]|uniref:Alkylhydroperoxidase AhpD family core domain-containing protein n=1 Tax=Tistlia consotensis USBA 355 TaxID=560819 RepID=A0A1Y6BAL8_9PROT|nr:carboxymuconolactone decarboxylase family protein [Tistlia consotensis]SMF01797.1 alkylhydroperoxidase AhpD family core domain-containing protein [Tistlia consotensis USBA 355]SNS37658.1 alkylhydroperoxidase AhpD family core domain-containing protein [Tistlia consotensis]